MADFFDRLAGKALPFLFFCANMVIDSCQCVPLHFMVPIGKLKEE